MNTGLYSDSKLSHDRQNEASAYPVEFAKIGAYFLGATFLCTALLPNPQAWLYYSTMFTGIIEEVGTIEAIENRKEAWRFRIACKEALQDAAPGDSIAVNGVCLTIVEFTDDTIDFDILDQTLRVTNLVDLKAGDIVNLERALRMQAKLGGHMVSGHVDQTSEILKIEPEGKNVRVDVAIPLNCAHRLIDKGSITIDGISLTIAELTDTQFTCWLIPKTLELTNLSTRSPGDQVNLEFDLVGKYIERMVRLDPSLTTQYQPA